MSYVLFYSSYCQASCLILQRIEKTKENVYFNKVCVDVDKHGNRPGVVKQYGIKKVPSIIADGNLYQGVQSFKWLSEKMNKRTDSGIDTREDKKITQIQQNRTNDSENVYEFKRKKNLIEDSEVIGDLNDVNIITPLEEIFNEKNDTKVKRDSLKTKQSNNIYNSLQKQRNNN